MISRLSFPICVLLIFYCTSLASATGNREWIKLVQDNDKLIIFVHGFTGHYKDTWQKFPNLISDDSSFGEFDVLVWGYPSHLFKRNPSTSRVGEFLQSELRNLEKNYQQVYLIGHSLGGLVIRSSIVHSLENGKSEELKNIGGILLFGTPNEGMPAARVIPRLVNEQIADLDSTGKFIDQLTRKWIKRVYRVSKNDNYHRNIRTAVVVGLEDRFVPKESVQSYFDNTEISSGTHISMVKPENSSHLSYRILKKFVLSKEIKNESKFNSEDINLSELISFYESRADNVRRTLKENIKYEPVSEYLKDFDELHAQHILALENGELIVAADILSQINTLSRSLEYNEFWTRHDNETPGISYKLCADAFIRGEMIRIYAGPKVAELLAVKAGALPDCKDFHLTQEQVTQGSSPVYLYGVLTPWGAYPSLRALRIQLESKSTK